MTTEDESMCFLANAMCRAACYRPEACDDYIDPEVVVDLQGKAAQNVKNLLKLCAPVSGLARATGVKPSNFSLEHSLGPVALRPFVWHHLFHQGQGMPVSRTEAMAYSAAVCDKHVLPYWTCGTEECSLCQGVASMYSSSQNAEQWCTTFQLKDSENSSETYARDLGRYYKCHYLSEYLESTEDKNRLSERKATIVETCESRTFCSEKSNTLPTLDMRPGLRQGTPEYADSQCRLCVEFVQRAAAGMKPKAFCNAIPSMYQQQRAFCEGTLEEMMAAIPGIKNAQERAFWSGWFGGEWSAGLAGNACNRLCQGAVKRNPAIKKTLKNPSPLLMAGEDSEPAPPGEASENWQPAAMDSITKSPWMKRALKSVKVSLPLRAVSGTQVVIWRLEDKVSGAISGWEALLKEIAWDGTFTQKRVWPRTGPTGVMSKKVQEAVFLMIREASLLRSHINFISAILETKLNLRVAVRTAEDLVRRMDLLVQNFDAMDQVLDGMKPSKVPSRFRRRLQKRARDQERLSVCYAVVVERHETYMPILDELSQSLREATDKLLDARQRGIRYSPKDTGLLDTLTKFYLVLPAEEQTRFTRLKQWLNPLNLFRTKLRIDKLVEQDSKDCSFRKVRKMTRSGVWKEFQSCCTERTQQVLGWETNIRNVNIQINKILDMMNYVKGNFVTRNIRKAYRAVRGAFVGADRKRGIWVEEEAADLLNLTANDFREALDEERRISSRRGAKYKRLTEEMFNSIGDRGIRRGFFRELRYDVVKRQARKELKEGKENFLKIRSLLDKLASRIAVDEENFPEITDEGNSSFEEVNFVIVESGRCEDEPHRRKASNLECRNRAMRELGFTFKDAMYFRSATPAGCVTYGGNKAYFRDTASGGDCGSRGASCICAVRVTGASS